MSSTDVEELTVGDRRPVRSTRRRLVVLILSAVVIGLLLAATNTLDITGGSERRLLAPDAPDLQIVVLGDSSAGEDSCAGWCFTYTEQLATSLRHETTRPVTIEDRSWRGNALPPASVDSVLAFLRTDPGLRDSVRTAEVLVLALPLRRSSPRTRTTDHFASQLDTLLSEVDRVRQERPLVLRLVITPDPKIAGHAGQQVSRAGCRVARSHRGACVEVSGLLQRGALTTSDLRSNGGHPRLSQRGHDVVARELISLASVGSG